MTKSPSLLACSIPARMLGCPPDWARYPIALACILVPKQLAVLSASLIVTWSLPILTCRRKRTLSVMLLDVIRSSSQSHRPSDSEWWRRERC